MVPKARWRSLVCPSDNHTLAGPHPGTISFIDKSYHKTVISSLFVPPTLVIPSALVGYKGGGGLDRVRVGAYVELPMSLNKKFRVIEIEARRAL